MSETKYLYVSADLSLTDPVKSEVQDRSTEPVGRYRIEQQDGIDVLIYDPEPPSPPSEPEVDEERWAFFREGSAYKGKLDLVMGPGGKNDPTCFHVRVVSKAKWDKQVEKVESLSEGFSELEAIATNLKQQVSTLTRERDDLSRKLAVAENELTLVRQELEESRVAHAKANEQAYAVDDERIHRIADLERQVAEAKRAERIARMDSDLLVRPQQPPSCAAATPIEPDKRSGDAPAATVKLLPTTTEPPFVIEGDPPSSGPADEGWMQKAWQDYYYDCKTASPRHNFYAALRAHAPAARYPEVVEFLDAVGDRAWRLLRWRGTMAYTATIFPRENTREIVDYHGDTLAAACRAALDSVKERGDG